MTVLVRPATAADREALVDIYNHYVVHTSVTFDLEPFTVATRRPWFDQFATTGRYRLLVAEEDGQLLGYAGSFRHRPKPAYDPTVETTVYCAPAAVGRAVGRHLYSALFDALAAEDVHRAVAGATLPNPASIRLHERFGFRHVGTYTEQGRKFGRYWDVAWMEKALG
jgi:phosphinothricin acetyltransferase